MKQGQYATRWRTAARRRRGPGARARSILRDGVLRVLDHVCRTGSGGQLRCLYAHHVFDDQREQFALMLSELQKLGRFVDTRRCVDMVTGAEEIDGTYFHLSFDDGLRNICTNATPVLSDMGVPALFFVASAIVGADWHAAKRYCLDKLDLPAPVEVATWDDLAEAASSGVVEIGSHTRTHARFSELSDDPERLADEIAGSKEEIEGRLGTACRYIAWPFGARRDADEASLQAAGKAGYKACFGGYRGTVQPGVTDLFSIPRCHVEPEWPLSHLRYAARERWLTAREEKRA